MAHAVRNAASRSLVKLLSNPPPKSCTTTLIDFTQIGIPEYKGSFAMLIHDALTADECQMLLLAAEATNDHKWDQALVNIGGGMQALYTDVRLCDRIIFDDTEVAAKIMDRVLPHLPENIITLRNQAGITGNGPVKRKETWKLSRLNERLRFLKYTKGMYFRQHGDGSYVTPDGEEMSLVTVHLYLNGDDDPISSREAVEDDSKPLIGGSTRFWGASETRYWDVSPKVGSILVFQHRSLIHSGEDVLQGTKYTMRSDILYRKVE